MTDRQTYSSISLFSGAGGMDVGFARAGFQSKVVCEVDKDACGTLSANLSLIGHKSNIINPSDILSIDYETLPKDVNVILELLARIFHAGKMNPDDSRSQLIFKFLDCVNHVKPLGFVCENVKALAISKRWENVRSALFDEVMQDYTSTIILLNSMEYGVPQARERMFFIGIRKDIFSGDANELHLKLQKNLTQYRKLPISIGRLIQNFGKAGSKVNPITCTAKIMYAKNPVLRRSPYAGMLFNGAGRPLSIDKYSSTLPASMGGNKTPIVDEDEIFNGKTSFVEKYHERLRKGGTPREGQAPSRLRRLTLTECKAIQTFPENFQFVGGKSSIYRQIGNAVPCELAFAVAGAYLKTLNNS